MNDLKFNVLFKKANYYFNKGNFKKSNDCCDKILTNFKDNLDVLFLKSKCFFELSKYSEALDIINYLLDNSQDNIEYLLLKLRIFYNADLNNECLILSNYILDLGFKGKEVYFIKSFALNSLGFYQDSLDLSDNFINYPNEIDYLIIKGSRFESLTNYESALKCFKESLKLDSNNSFVLFMIADLLNKQKLYYESLYYLEECLKIDESNVNAWLTKGNVFINLNDFSQAHNCFLKALDYDSSFDLCWSNMGDLYLLENSLDKALFYYNKGLESAGDSYFLYYGKIKSLFLLGELEESLHICDFVLNLTQYNIFADLWFLKSKIQFELKDNGALTSLDECLKRSGGDSKGALKMQDKVTSFKDKILLKIGLE